MHDESIEAAIDEARRRGCSQLLVASKIVEGIRDWLDDLRSEVAQFGESEGPPSWNLVLADSWDPAASCMCALESAATFTDVEVFFFVIDQRSREVIDWCRDPPRDAQAALNAFKARWGEPYARVKLGPVALSP